MNDTEKNITSDFSELSEYAGVCETFTHSIKEYAIFLIDVHGNILSWNQGAALIKGYTEQEIIGKNIAIFYTNQDQKKKLPQKNLQSAKENGSYECEGWRIKKDGSQFWADIVITALYNKKNVLIGFLKITREVTERKNQEDKFKGLIETCPDAIIICNKNGNIEIINRQTELLFGFKRSELIGNPVEILVPENNREKHRQHRKKYVQMPKTRPMGEILDLYAKKKDGSIFPVEISLAPLKINGNTWISAVIRDITERKKLNDNLKKTNEDLRMLATKIQNVKEEERTAIAREIHDELGQRLTALKIDISWILKKMGKEKIEIRQKSDEILKMLDGTIKIIRKISADLRPSILDDLGLIEALKWYGIDFEKRTGIKVKFQSAIADFVLPNEIATGIFRIYQESLTNVARHADAKNVNANIGFTDSKITLTITDDGKGFDARKIAEKKTLGLLGIGERALLMGGECKIKSSPGQGTTVIVTIHLK